MKDDILSRSKRFILRLLFFIVILIVLVLLGAMIGYGVLGQSNPFHVLTPSFWSSLFDIL